MAYLYPNLGSKAAYKRALAEGTLIRAQENTPGQTIFVENGHVDFEGPHSPQPHCFYGRAEVRNGRVVKITR